MNRAPSPEDLLPKRLQHWRKRRGLTQARLGELLASVGWDGADRRLVSKVEAGLRRVAIDELFFFAEVLGVGPRALLLPDAEGEAVSLGSQDVEAVDAHWLFQSGERWTPEEERPVWEVWADRAVPSFSTALRELIRTQWWIGFCAERGKWRSATGALNGARVKLAFLESELAQRQEAIARESGQTTPFVDPESIRWKRFEQPAEQDGQLPWLR